MRCICWLIATKPGKCCNWLVPGFSKYRNIPIAWWWTLNIFHPLYSNGHVLDLVIPLWIDILQDYTSVYPNYLKMTIDGGTVNKRLWMANFSWIEQFLLCDIYQVLSQWSTYTNWNVKIYTNWNEFKNTGCPNKNVPLTNMRVIRKFHMDTVSFQKCKAHIILNIMWHLHLIRFGDFRTTAHCLGVLQFVTCQDP